jgi:hypothetical protein
LLVSPEMKAQADRLKKIIQPRGIAVEMREIASADDFAAMQQTCEGIIAENPEAELTLNVTGGTKIAALAAFQAFYFNFLSSHNPLK